MLKKGIALSGGGIKSYGQLPLLQAFEEADVIFDFVSGTSMGSAIAALIAMGKSANEITQIALEIETRLVKTKAFVKPSPKILPFSKDRIHGGFVDGLLIEEIVKEVLGDVMLRDVKIPLAIPAVDILTGKVIVFVSHPHLFKAQEDWVVVSDIELFKVVRASCSFPLVIAGMAYDDYLLADGGIKMNLPSQLLNAYGVDKVAAITMTSEDTFSDVDSALALGNRIYDLMVESTNKLMEPHVDLMMNVPIGDVWVFEFGKGQKVIEEGEAVVSKYLDGIEAFGKDKKSFFSIFKK